MWRRMRNALRRHVRWMRTAAFVACSVVFLLHWRALTKGTVTASPMLPLKEEEETVFVGEADDGALFRNVARRLLKPRNIFSRRVSRPSFCWLVPMMERAKLSLRELPRWITRASDGLEQCPPKTCRR